MVERRKHRRTSPSIWTTFFLWIDRWMLWISSALVAAAWGTADVLGIVWSEGTKAAFGAFIAYAVLKSKSDQRWRALEVSHDRLEDLRDLVAELEKTSPGSPEALKARKDLVALAMETHRREQEDR